VTDRAQKFIRLSLSIAREILSSSMQMVLERLRFGAEIQRAARRRIRRNSAIIIAVRRLIATSSLQPWSGASAATVHYVFFFIMHQHWPPVMRVVM